MIIYNAEKQTTNAVITTGSAGVRQLISWTSGTENEYRQLAFVDNRPESERKIFGKS
jgi:hypothetical protein